MRISDWCSDVCSSDLSVVVASIHICQTCVIAEMKSDCLTRCFFHIHAPSSSADMIILRCPNFEIATCSKVLPSASEIGRASGRERGCQYVEISVVAV